MLFVKAYAQVIEWVVAHAGGADKFTHMSAGLAIWILASLLLRQAPSHFFPLAVVIIAEAANEGMDRLAHGSWRPADTATDVLATLFWPTLLFFYHRFVAGLRQEEVFQQNGLRRETDLEANALGVQEQRKGKLQLLTRP